MGLKEKTGLAMYTVHRAVHEDMGAAFEKAAALGYRGMEFYGEPENFPAKDVRAALRNSGLEITGWHIGYRRLHEESFQNTVQHLQSCGCTTAVIQCLGGKWNIGHDQSRECKDRWLYYAEWMNRTGERLKKEGLCLGYHNHEHEFLLKYDEKSVYDLLYENLSPDIVMELDSGNCIEGGGDPLSVLEKYKDRRVLLHLKPYSFQRGFDVVLGDEDDANDWQALLHQPWVSFERILVESENTALPEMENAERCLENLKRYLD